LQTGRSIIVDAEAIVVGCAEMLHHAGAALCLRRPHYGVDDWQEAGI
jgi:hypothetical protein